MTHRSASLLRRAVALLCLAPLAFAAPVGAVDAAALQQQVADAERAFARSMAERDFAAFARHVSAQAVFFSAGETLRGREAVLAGWRKFFDGPQAPFAWEPDQVEVLADGTLAHSSGPVRDPAGTTLTRFNSVWRLEPDGIWRVVFDRGDPPCRCAAAAADGDGG